MAFVVMEDLLDKLKLLGYDEEFLKKNASYKPLSKHYFALATNPGEQFFLFTNVAAWLIQKSGNSRFEFPQEHDDPNATVSSILAEMRKLDVPVDFPPNKLKSGAGEQALYVLDRLADAALKSTNFAWEKPIPPTEGPDEGEDETEEAEVTAEQFEEADEEPEAAEDDDEGGFLDLEGLKNLSKQKSTHDPFLLPGAGEEKAEILKPDTDAAAWRMEVERVLPSLKITVRQDAKDWRAHLEQMETYRTSLNETLAQTGPQLTRLADEIGKNLEKVNSREKYLNSQLEGLLAQFRAAQLRTPLRTVPLEDRLAETREKYKESSVGVTERSRALASITDELEGLRQEMEERGLSLTDGAPLVKVKQAIARLEKELVGMDVQIGVIEQSLLQSQMRDRTNLHLDMHALPPPNASVY